MAQIPVGWAVAPPFVEADALRLLEWLAWFASAACVAGIIITATRMAILRHHHHDMELRQLGWVLMACVLIGGASALVGALF
jgi:hypothetical protein